MDLARENGKMDCVKLLQEAPVLIAKKRREAEEAKEAAEKAAAEEERLKAEDRAATEDRVVEGGGKSLVEGKVMTLSDILDGIESALHVGGLPPNIPSPYLREWTHSLSSPIGKGGFGTVYKGGINMNGVIIPIAVKQLSPHLQLSTLSVPSGESDATKALINSVKKEVNSLSNFRHPNVIRLVGYSLPEKGILSTSNLFIVYELAEGGDLASMLTVEERARSYPWQARINTLYGVAKALWCLHSQKIYHRDIKSANIALTGGNGTAKIIDWGLAKFIPKASDQALSAMPTSAGGIASFGTAGYQCPLFVFNPSSYFKDGEFNDPKFDIFSFGVVVGEVCAGRLQGKDGVLLHDLDDEEIVFDARAGKWDSKCQESLKELMAGCIGRGSNTRKQYANRFPSMQRAVQILHQLHEDHCQVDPRVVLSEEELQATRDELAAVKEEMKGMKRVEADTKAVMRTCDECGVACGIHGGIGCPSSMLKEKNHFLCNDCFSASVSRQSSPLYSKYFRDHNGEVVCESCRTAPCTVAGCKAEKEQGVYCAHKRKHRYTMRDIALHVDDATYGLLIRAREAHLAAHLLACAPSPYPPSAMDGGSSPLPSLTMTPHRYRYNVEAYEALCRIAPPLHSFIMAGLTQVIDDAPTKDAEAVLKYIQSLSALSKPLDPTFNPEDQLEDLLGYMKKNKLEEVTAQALAFSLSSDRSRGKGEEESYDVLVSIQLLQKLPFLRSLLKDEGRVIGDLKEFIAKRNRVAHFTVLEESDWKKYMLLLRRLIDNIPEEYFGEGEGRDGVKRAIEDSERRKDNLRIETFRASIEKDARMVMKNCTEKSKADLRGYIDNTLKAILGREGEKGEGGMSEEKVREMIVEEMCKMAGQFHSPEP